MLSNESYGNGNGGAHKSNSGSGKTIDLQGVAAFAGLVELLATELGTSPGRIQGLLPSGPASFEELVGEITLNNKGFQRTLTLGAKPGSPLRLRFRCLLRDSLSPEAEAQAISGVESHYFLDTPVEQIVPQGRALARYIEDTFAVMDRMATLGKANKLGPGSPSLADVEAFEQSEDRELLETNWAQSGAEFEP